MLISVHLTAIFYFKTIAVFEAEKLVDRKRCNKGHFDL